MVRAVHKLFPLIHNKRIANLPKQYIDYIERSRAPKERVHDDPPTQDYLDYTQDKNTGYVYRIPDHPVPVVYPPDSEMGLWGGLGMVEGFEKPKRFKPRITRLWRPQIEKHTFYSDILDFYINVTVTERTLELIDKHEGFDFYILSTRYQDLVSELGRRIKHKMQLKLATDDREYIKEKYKDFIKPLDEIMWDGLKTHEALTKFKLMRIEETIEPPLKQTYANQLLESLRKSKQQPNV